MKARGGIALLLATALSAGSVAAQSTLSGAVRARADSSAIAEAQVSVPELSLQATTDGKGRFRFESIPAGRYVVLVRRIGFDSVTATLAFTGDDDVKHDFELVPVAQPLPAVPVTGKEAPITNAKLRQFDERRKFGVGRFLTAGDLERDQDKLLSNVLSKLPGIHIVTGKATAGGGGLAAYVASSRGAFSIQTQSKFFGSKCPVAIWLDGILVYRGNDHVVVNVKTGITRSLGAEEPPFDINQIHTRHIAGLEFYAGAAQLPAQLNVTQGTCGALVIWTQ